MEKQTEKSISIAVLPFKNISNSEENNFFCDGITEEIINAFSRIEQLKVTSRTSSFYFKDHSYSLQEISEKLGVNVILEGSVRVSGNSLRIRAQLIDVIEDTTFWTETWDRKKENLFEIQDEISLIIADKLREHEGHLTISDQLVNFPTQNITAYEHLLKGRYHFYKWNPEDVNIAINEFEKALALDPNLIDALLGSADSYSFMAVAGFAPREESWMKAVEAMQLAKVLDPNHAGLNLMLSHHAFFTEANFSSAMKFIQKAVVARPTYAEAHQFLSFFNTLKGDFNKAKEHILYAKSVDPLNPETRFFQANYLYRTNELDEAIKILNALLEENEKNLPALIVSTYIHIKENRLKEAKALIKKTPNEVFTPDEKLGLNTLVDVLTGNQDTELLKELEEHANDPLAHHAHSYLFIIYANLGRFDEAFAVLEKIFKDKSSILLLGFSDPLSEPIKSDPRYAEYHKRIYPEVSDLHKVKRTQSKSFDNANAKAQVERLQGFIESESPFLNPSLSLRSLAEQTDIHPNQLSWLLNEYLGKNFNEFINQKRVEHFKKLVVDPSNSHISLIGLAYESGFNSKTVFNTAFKKVTGMTPKEYQKSQS
ncbi:helix-turn-helix domain-containing protein [Algoriphagus machipongonensis]|uniref:Adenylate/guanylate cyclase n=1 Tax=Algoriphagus machipongonensis TaxID=388413 RepID=A3I071_9BACT|nr:helix-turn-helix domain-containing protein [Algoriphagus machipongonensis]EAZ79867.1 adenylate/guanylate cyclase [Algoriphagus machipongonensis]